MRILIVDDNPDIAESLCVLLNIEGYEARAAHSGETALALAREFRPDVAVIDLLLPDIDGYELAARLRRDAGCQHTRLIACSGHITAATANRARAAGMDPFLIKPFDPEVLLLILERVQAVAPAAEGTSAPSCPARGEPRGSVT